MLVFDNRALICIRRELTVRILRIDEKASSTAPIVKLSLRSTIRENSVYNSIWPAEASLSGSLEVPADGGLVAETGLMMCPTHDALIILDRRLE
jgi:hypothetical protein